MNIKSLILGSAAALVIGGAAQAADLPVAEPVDYVRICDAYGAGYWFIPGTDTCINISGAVSFEIEQGFIDHFGDSRDENLVEMDTDVDLVFTVQEETEFDTLTAVIDLEGSNGIAGGSRTFMIDKAYIQLGGFVAGLTDSFFGANAGVAYDDFGIGDEDLDLIGYAFDFGNGFSAGISLEEYTGNQDISTAANDSAGISMPAFAANLGVTQGWGSVGVSGIVYQIRYDNATIDTDLGWAIAGNASFTFDAVTFGVAGGYEEGTLGLLPFNSITVAGTTTPFHTWNGSMSNGWVVSTGLTYNVNDMASFGVDFGYTAVDPNAGSPDVDIWGVSGFVAYDLTENFEIKGQVGYRDWDVQRSSVLDGSDWAARLDLTRSF